MFESIINLNSLNNEQRELVTSKHRVMRATNLSCDPCDDCCDDDTSCDCRCN